MKAIEVDYLTKEFGDFKASDNDTNDDRIDYAVGFENLVALEDWVDSQVPLTRIHARDEKSLEVAKSIIEKAYRIGERKMTRKNSTIIEQISNG